MKKLHNETNWAPAAEVIDVATLVIRLVRAELRRRPVTALSYSQVRALAFLRGNPGASLSELAEHLGVGAPTASKLVEELVQQELVEREAAEEDRRRLTLRATAGGRRTLEQAAEPARREVAERMQRLTDRERATVEEAMALLLPLFAPCETAAAGELHE